MSPPLRKSIIDEVSLPCQLEVLQNRDNPFILMAMKIFLWIAGAGIVFFLLDRILLKMESRGWIYYRRKKPTRSSLGNAFLEIQSILEPSKKVLVEIKKEEKKEQADSGDPPTPEDRAPAAEKNPPLT